MQDFPNLKFGGGQMSLKRGRVRSDIEEKYDHKTYKHFQTKYRIARERCCNPKNKDYGYYRDKWFFNSFDEFYDNCFDDYILGVNKFGMERLSIDRIDSKQGYRIGNIRFVSMTENLRNKDYVKSVKLINEVTGEEICYPSFFSIGGSCDNDARFSTGGVHRAYKENRLYKKIWKIVCID